MILQTHSHVFWSTKKAILWIQTDIMLQYFSPDVVFFAVGTPYFLFYALQRFVHQKPFPGFYIIEAITALSREIAVGQIICNLHKMLGGGFL